MDEPGIPAFTTSFPVEHGFINLANGNLHIEIPIATYPQRGNIKALHARLVYDSRFWIVRIDPVTEASTWTPNGIAPIGISVGGFRLITDGESGNTSFSQSTQVACYITDGTGVQHPQYLTTFSNFTYQDPEGTMHRAPGSGALAFKLYYNPSNCPGQQTTPSGTTYSTDNDRYKFVVDNSNGSISTSVFESDGSQVVIPGAAIGSAMVQDTNGNFVSIAPGQNVGVYNVVDALGRTPVIATFSGNQAFLDYLCVPGTSGCDPNNGNRARVTVTAVSAGTNFTTSFNQSGVGEYSGPSFAGSASMVLPDGSSYQFQFDSYGMLTSMTLPTGGQINYGWTNEADYQGHVNRWVTSRTVDGQTWSFPPTQLPCSTPPCTQQVTVTTPSYNDGSTTASDTHVYTFSVSNGWYSPGAIVTQIQYFRGSASGTPVLTKNIDYALPSCPTPNGSLGALLPGRETLTWPAGSGTSSKKVEYCYDANNNLTTTKMWDYQPNGNFAAAPDREIDNVYKTDTAYINANILRLLASSTRKDASGAQVAQTTYGYDESDPQPSGVTINHVTPTTPRANLTSVSKWLNTTGGSVTSTTAYYDTGEVYQPKDPLLNPTTYTYDSTGAYPSQVCNAKNQCSYSAYDFNTGLLTTFTDANGSALGDPAHTTTYTYDSMLRPLCTNLPDGGQTCASYPDPNHVTQQKKVTSSLTDASAVVLDDLGRTSQTQHTLPNGVAKVDTTYDTVGAVATVSNPYFTTGDATYGVTQSFHDALGRMVKTVKQDGSIALAAYSVLNSGGLSGVCSTSTDETGKQRTSCHNGFGETIEVQEPGDAFSGTAASGGLTISGAVQSKAAVPATPGAGSVTLSGTEQSRAGAAGAGSVTIQGYRQSFVDTSNCRIVNHIQVCTTVYDHGTVYLTVNGVPESCGYGQTSNITSSAIASCLAGQLTNDPNSPVNATASGSTVDMTARVGGASTNYGFSVASNWDSVDFASPSYTGNPSSGNLSGGTTIYDSGTCTVTVNGTPYGQSFGQGGSISSIASGLASAISGGSLVSATASGATISLTAKTGGTATNYSLSSSCSYDSADFGSASFTASASGSSLTGGTDGSPAVTDAGTVQMSVGGYSATANYGNGTGQDSTATAVASDLVAKIQAQLPGSNPPFTITSAGAGININWNSVGAAGNVTVSTTSTTTQTGNFSTPSFASCSITTNPQNCSTALTGGQDPYSSGIAHPFVTLYTYDPLGNLTCVEQHGDASTGSGCSASPSSDATSPWRVRRFTYDSLSRLATSSNPESNTAIVNSTPTRVATAYSYDADGNLLQKTSLQANQTGTATTTISYCYEPLNRVTGKAYSAQTCQNGQLPPGTAVVSYGYDSGTNGVGHLTSLTDQAGSGVYSYDNMGRISSEQRTIAGQSNSMSYLYYLDGSVKTLTYPSNAVVTYTPWNNGTNAAAGIAQSATDNGGGINYITSGNYQADEQITNFVSGNTGSFAGITNSFSYNKRLQPINMSAASPSQAVFSIGYDFHVGNGSSGSDNGNVWGITNYKDNNRNQSFTYDALNRLTSAQNAGTDCNATVLGGNKKFWGNTYTYDAWGNLTNKTKIPSACSGEGLNVTAGTNNQLQSGYTYDAAGNMTYNATPPTQSYTYDAENRISTAITSLGTETYTYDADGNRVEKSNGTTGTLYWYMSPGIVGESDLSGNLTAEYVFFDGERVARKDLPGNAVSYYFSDHLKTTDIVTDAQGNIKNESDFYPWGGELQFLANDSNHYKFTGKERDSETQLDYFGARYYSNGLGRFITPDWAAKPEPVPYADRTDPQTLNQYSYVRNIPTVKVDADGHATGVEEVVEAGLKELVDSAIGAVAKGVTTTQLVFGAVGVVLFSSTKTAGAKDDDFDPRLHGQSQQTQTQTQNGHTQTEEPKPQPEPAPAAGGRGTIYRVPPSGTKSGKPYYGRHNKPNPSKTRRSNDGRDRKQAEVVDTYDAANTQEGRQKEQQQLDQTGLQNTDNKRNEIAPKPKEK
jgi:RHS repeat-associated protein